MAKQQMSEDDELQAVMGFAGFGDGEDLIF